MHVSNFAFNIVDYSSLWHARYGHLNFKYFKIYAQAWFNIVATPFFPPESCSPHRHEKLENPKL